MDKAIHEAINKLTKGQEKMGKDISEIKAEQVGIKADISEMKTEQVGIKADISEIKAEQGGIKADISEMKTEQVGIKADITEIKAEQGEMKVSQQQFEGLIHKVLDSVARIERVVVNIENDLRPKVHVLLDADKIRQDDTAELKQVCREQEKQLTDHEIRISRLEN